MGYGNECPRCGASLDPGERCDCTENADRTYNANVIVWRDCTEKTDRIEVADDVQLCNVGDDKNRLFCVS